MKKKNEDILLQETYDMIHEKIMELIIIKKIEPQMVAGTLLAQALKIYKTTLTDDDYYKMIDAIKESADKIPNLTTKRTLN